MAVKKIETFKEYEEVVEASKKKPVFVGFSRDGCSACVEIQPTFEKVAEETELDFYKIHFTADTPEDEIEKFEKVAHIQGFPTFVYLYFGVEFAKLLSGSDKVFAAWVKLITNNSEDGGGL